MSDVELPSPPSSLDEEEQPSDASSVLPQEWRAIVTADVAKQQQMAPQPPLSDEYLAGARKR